MNQKIGKIVTIRGEDREVRVEHDGSRFRHGSSEIELVEISAGEAEIRVGGRTHTVPYLSEGSQVSFLFDGTIYTAEVTDPAARARTRARHHTTAAPMPGLVSKILVAPGDVVKKGAPLLILEAMKMEHPITSPHDGTVAAIRCQQGELVQPGVELVEVTPAPLSS